MSTLDSPAGDDSDLPIAVSGLTKRFGVKVALTDFSLALGRGRIFGAVGANGGGKTTALRILAGLLPADGGGGRVLGVDLRAHPARLRACVGYMTQHHSLYRDLTVTENLLARARIYGIANPRARVAESIEEFGLDRFAHERVSRLSGGWMRRVQFAATLVPRPAVLLLDEPTAGLDLQTAQHLWEATADLAARGTTVVISTHDLSEAGRCDAVAVFVEGRVTAQGTVAEVVERSRARVVRVAAARATADPVDAATLRAGLREVAFVRRGAHHHDLVFRGDPPSAALAWLRERQLSAQDLEPTLEDAMSIYVHAQNDDRRHATA